MVGEMRETTLQSKGEVKRQRSWKIGYILTVLVIIIILSAISITLGVANISVIEVYQILFNQIFPGTFDILPKYETIVVNIRAPRVLMAVAAGAGLAIGGCLTQSILRNSLATPYTLGISSGASFGAALFILYGISIINGVYGQILNAFIFSLIPVAIILIASERGSMTPTTMVLCGISISYIFSACNTLMQYFGTPDAVKGVVFWSVGDLNNSVLWQVPYVGVVAIGAFIISMILSRSINIMKMGDDTAASLGVDVKSTRKLAILVACLTTATIVSFVGAIGFICLLAPHISRRFVGGDMRYLIPASAVTGAILLVLADIVAKTAIDPVMLPVGAITALCGGPLLVFLLIRKRGAMA